MIELSPQLAYHWTQPINAPAPLCEVTYTDARVLPLCPCTLPPVDGMGTLISIVVLASAAVYLFGGLAYGRFVSPQTQGLDARQGSSGTLAAHPHHQQWLELPGLLADGWRYTRMLVGMDTKRDWETENYRRGQYKDLEEINDQLKAGFEQDAETFSVVVAPNGGKGAASPPSRKGKSSRRKSETAAGERKDQKRKKAKKKPRPSLPSNSASGVDGGLE